MRPDDHPILRHEKIENLRPTQLTVGLREVARKRAAWAHLKGEEERRFLGSHLVPVVVGPKGHTYIIDNHHLTRALHDEGIDSVLIRPIADLGHLGRDEFWRHLDMRNWVRLYDAEGQRRPFGDLPKTVAGLKDDPYRSLAGDLRRAGGFAKDPTPYAEFLWADHLRGRLKAGLVDKDYARALNRGMTLVREKAADYLPGWCGAED